MLLVADIGGTKSALAVFQPEAGPRAPVARKEYPSSSYPSLEAIVKEFLLEVPYSIDTACFGVAGPVVEGRARTTNLPWIVDEARLGEVLGLKSVRLLNDLEATAHAIPILHADELHTLHAGQPENGGAVALIAPGTGLGEAFLIWGGAGYTAHPSEGGHADFAPTDGEQAGLLEYLQQRFGHVSYERVCSGIGIPNIYDYLRDKRHAPETDAVTARLSATADRTRVIIDAALSPTPCPLCAATLEMFVSILGAEAGNLALKVLATGGIYLAGGISGRILPALRDERFLRAIRDKGRFEDILTRVPVQVIVGDAAVIGTAVAGLRHP